MQCGVPKKWALSLSVVYEANISMSRVYVSVGSNIDREHNIRSCIRQLDEVFGHLVVSTIYETTAVGFKGENFFNLVVGFDTDKSLEVLVSDLRNIETAHGRRRLDAPKFSARTLDLDLLLYGDQVGTASGVSVPSEDILRYGFVLGPLAEVAGARFHPVLKRTFTELWDAFDANQGKLEPLDFACHGSQLSPAVTLSKIQPG